MSNIRIELNKDEVRAWLKSEEMQSMLNQVANDVATRAGDGYQTGSMISSDRVKATVYTASYAARRDNLENNTLLKSL